MLQEFVQEIEDTARDVVNEIHTVLPGKILAYDAGSGKATVQPIGQYQTSTGEKIGFPKITEVPIVLPHCTSLDVGIAFPIKVGDSCLILVSEIELDEWRTGAESEGTLRFDLSSSVAIPGLLKSNNTLATEAISSGGVVVGAGDTRLVVKSSGVSISGSLSVTGSISVGSNLNVSGNINYNGTLNNE